MGNSEVGHLNIGAGRVVFQELTRINRACRDGSIAVNPEIVAAFETAKKQGAALHLMGLRLRRRRALLQRAPLRACGRRRGGRGAAHHGALLHGRPRRAARQWGRLYGRARRSSGAGCVEGPGWRALRDFHRLRGGPLLRHGSRQSLGTRGARPTMPCVCAEPFRDLAAVAAMEASYGSERDRRVRRAAWPWTPAVCATGDAVIFFNFRPDRAREITRAFVDPAFDGFARKKWLPACTYVCITEYDAGRCRTCCWHSPQEFPENDAGRVPGQRWA